VSPFARRLYERIEDDRTKGELWRIPCSTFDGKTVTLSWWAQNDRDGLRW
jgi:hypothetical protein